MEEKRLQLPHRLTLQERQQLTVTGVREVMRFDENAVVLRTEKGILTAHGKDLQLKQMAPDGGLVTVAGSLTALVYEEPRAAGSWLGRLFG
jgi:sporulation protein YabP